MVFLLSEFFGEAKETAMTLPKVGRMVFSRCLIVGWAILIAGVLNIAQAQYAPPPPPPAPPPPPPVFNPSPSNTTVSQPSYKSISPTTPSTGSESEVTSPANEEPPTAPSERGPSVTKTRSVHHHYRGRSAIAGHCGYYHCARIYPWAFYASARWVPGYYDYAPGQLGRGHPRYWGWARPYGYHGD